VGGLQQKIARNRSQENDKSVKRGQGDIQENTQDDREGKKDVGARHRILQRKGSPIQRKETIAKERPPIIRDVPTKDSSCRRKNCSA